MFCFLLTQDEPSSVSPSIAPSTTPSILPSNTPTTTPTGTLNWHANDPTTVPSEPDSGEPTTTQATAIGTGLSTIVSSRARIAHTWFPSYNTQQENSSSVQTNNHWQVLIVVIFLAVAALLVAWIYWWKMRKKYQKYSAVYVDEHEREADIEEIKDHDVKFNIGTAFGSQVQQNNYILRASSSASSEQVSIQSDAYARDRQIEITHSWTDNFNHNSNPDFLQVVNNTGSCNHDRSIFNSGQSIQGVTMYMLPQLKLRKSPVSGRNSDATEDSKLQLLSTQSTQFGLSTTKTHNPVDNHFLQFSVDLMTGINVSLFGIECIDSCRNISMSNEYNVSAFEKLKRWTFRFDLDMINHLHNGDFNYYMKMYQILKDFIYNVLDEYHDEYITKCPDSDKSGNSSNHHSSNRDTSDSKTNSSNSFAHFSSCGGFSARSGLSTSGGHGSDDHDSDSDDRNRKRNWNDKISSRSSKKKIKKNKKKQKRGNKKAQSKQSNDADDDHKVNENDSKNSDCEMMMEDSDNKTNDSNGIADSFVETQLQDVGRSARRSIRKIGNVMDYENSPLSEIMSLRGICQCSGHCGNPLMKFSLLFYKSVLDGVLPFDLFNKHVLPTDSSQFWSLFVKNFLENDKINIMYNDCNSKNKIEWFKQIIKLIEEMVDTMSIGSNFDILEIDRTWQDNGDGNHGTNGKDGNINTNIMNINDDGDKKSNWQQTMRDIINDVKTDKANRKQTVRSTISVMFDSFGEMYETCKNESKIDETKENETDFTVNRLLRAMMIHNYCESSIDSGNVKQLLFGVSMMMDKLSINSQNSNSMSSMSQSLSDSDFSDISDNLSKEQFKNHIWQKIDYALFSVLRSKSDDLEHFSLMRFLIILVNFLVECHATVNTNIKCLVNTINSGNSDKNKMTDEEKLINEMKRNGMYSTYKQISIDSSIVQQKYDDARNVSMGRNKLTEMEIGCIYMWTLNSICDVIKPCHRRGETCKYREYCKTLINALKKLKENDIHAKMERIKSVYSGVSRVTFNTRTGSESTMMQQFIAHHCSTNGKQLINNKINYCLTFDTLLSTSRDAVVALDFSSNNIGPNQSGIVFDIDFGKLYANPDLYCGDISWLSNTASECEILVAPCMIWVYKLRKELWPPCCKNQSAYKYGKQGKDSIVFGAELRTLGNVSSLMQQARRVKQQMIEFRQSNINNNANDQNYESQSLVSMVTTIRKTIIKAKRAIRCMTELSASEKKSHVSNLCIVIRVLNNAQNKGFDAGQIKIAEQGLIREIFQMIKETDEEHVGIDLLDILETMNLLQYGPDSTDED